jgi:PAS domain S-box-containing protein
MNNGVFVLVVDDDPDVLRLTARLLRRYGYVVAETDSSAGCLAYCADHSPDLILLDVVLPDIDGFEVCRRLKADTRLKDTFILMVSAKKISVPEQAEGIGIGADGYLTRPFSNEVLKARLEALTRIQQTQKRLRQHRHLLSTALQELAEAVIHTDRSGRITLFNPAAERLTGKSHAEILGRPLIDVIALRWDITDIPISDPVPDVLRQGMTVELSGALYLLRPDGSRVYVISNAAPTRSDTGEITGTVFILLDASVQRQQQLALKIARQEWEQIFEAIGHPAMVLDADFRIIRVNQALVDATGQRRTALIGQPCHRVFHRTRHSPDGCPLKKSLTSHTTEKEDMEMEALSRTFLVSCTPVTMDGCTGTHYIHIATDITARKRMELELAETNNALHAILKKKEEDRAQAADKLRTQVDSVIKPYLETVKDSGLTQEQTDLVITLESELEALLAPLFSSLPAAYPQLTPTEIRIADLIRQGCRSKEIADILNISAQTVEFHRKNIRLKLGLRQRKVNLRTQLLSID